jgi:hypothetical protein
MGCLLAVAALAGCATEIRSIKVAPAQEGAPISVAAEIAPSWRDVPPPAVEVRSDSNGTAYQRAGTLAPAGSGQYQAQLPPQPYGKSTVQVRVTEGDKSTTREQPFYVAARPACFAFDAPEKNAQGWSLHGLFENGNPGVQLATCSGGPDQRPGIKEPAPRVEGVNFPEAFPGSSGALSVPLSSACFPLVAGSNTRWWTLDFVSPSLEQRGDWQVARFSFAIRSADAHLLPRDRWPRLQAMLKVRKADNTESYYAEQDAAGAFRYETVTADWQRFTFTFQPPAGATVLEARIRYFGAPSPRPSDAAAQVDLVCPE